MELLKLEPPKPMPPNPPMKRTIGGPTPGVLQGASQIPTKQAQRLPNQFPPGAPPFGMQ